ncbi:MAG: energy-coupling factor ABC transporter substrate-binding protein [archaeon]|nr:energy-coupling factor ABC transporter substrate-binding protein [archaeon]
MNNKIIYVVGFAIIAMTVIGTLAWGNANGKDFNGADDGGRDIANKRSDGGQLTKGIWGDYKLPTETESLLFAFQAAIGAIIIGYFIGRVTKGKK